MLRHCIATFFAILQQCLGVTLQLFTMLKVDQVMRAPNGKGALNSPVSRKLEYLRNVNGLQLNRITQHPVAVGDLKMYSNLWDPEL